MKVYILLLAFAIIFFHRIVYRQIIIRQNSVYAHFKIVFRFFGIIRPKYIAKDSMGMRFINAFLIEIRLE